MRRWTRAALAAFFATLVLAGTAQAYELLFDYRRDKLEDIQVQELWDAGLTGDGVTVAILDSGVKGDHVGLEGRLAQGRHYFFREEADGKYNLVGRPWSERYNYYSDEDTEDPDGHGTKMAGIVLSVAPNVTIMPVRCIGDDAEGVEDETASCVISGIEYALEYGADVINMSFKVWGARSEKTQEAIQKAVDAGVIVVAAAGNDGSETLNYPAAYEGVIGVGAVNILGKLSDWSNHSGSVDICAPGENIWTFETYSRDAIMTVSGTSASTAMVSGAAALMKERYPEMTCGEFEKLLKISAEPLAPGAGVKAGMMNVYRLYQSKRVLDALDEWIGALKTGEKPVARWRRSYEGAREKWKEKLDMNHWRWNP